MATLGKSQIAKAPTTIMSAGASLDDADIGEIRRLIEKDGAVLLRGFEAEIENFGKLGQSLCTSALFNESPNRELLEVDGRVQSVNLGADPFPLHPELAREPWRPDLAMFACFSPPNVGGQTNICDGIAIAENMPEHVRHELEGKRLFYVRPASPEMLLYWLGTERPTEEQINNPPEHCPYWFRRGEGRTFRGFTRPALELTLFQQEPAFANFALFARDYLRTSRVPLLEGQPISDDLLDEIRVTARRLTYSHEWERGDVLLLDNTRYMHGRKAIANADERRIATFFGYLKGVDRRDGEPPNPIWRRQTFVPPEMPHET